MPNAAANKADSRPTGTFLVPVLGTLGIVLITGAVLRAMGRVWWCACATPTPFVSDIWSNHCSQHLFDPYSLSHVSHGLLFSIAFGWMAQGGLAGRVRPSTAVWFLAAVALEAGWEILENTPMVIERYRTQTASLNYNGDSIVNSLGDVISCAAGYLLARRIGPRRAFLLFLALELVMLLWIRDNLTLNVVMLIAPIQSIKQWQTPPTVLGT